MATPNNPPQLQLQLGHQTFKRSFHQFGLDVDDTDDSENANSGASNYSSSSNTGVLGSSSSGSSNISSASGSASSRASRSTSGGSNYSSLGSSEYNGGHHGSQRNERNKRARSDGPDTARIMRNDETEISNSTAPSPSSGGLNTMQHVHTGSPRALTEYDSEGASSSSSTTSSIDSTYNAPLSTPWHPRSFSSLDDSLSSSLAPSLNALPAPSLPMPDFNPPTPNLAEFSAIRNAIRNSEASHPSHTTVSILNNAAISTENERLPGFAAMLAPRLSSPAPPPAGPLADTEMETDDSLLTNDHQLESPVSSPLNMNIGTGPREGTGLITSATSLRRALDRAAVFERTLAPLRSEANANQSANEGASQLPHLPRFDFEEMSRQSDSSSNSTGQLQRLVINLNSRTTRSSPEPMTFSNPLASEEEDVEADDIAVDRSLLEEGVLSHAAITSSPRRFAYQRRWSLSRQAEHDPSDDWLTSSTSSRAGLTSSSGSRDRPVQPSLRWDRIFNMGTNYDSSSIGSNFNPSSSVASTTNAVNSSLFLSPPHYGSREEEVDSESDSERIERMVRLDMALDLPVPNIHSDLDLSSSSDTSITFSTLASNGSESHSQPPPQPGTDVRPNAPRNSPPRVADISNSRFSLPTLRSAVLEPLDSLDVNNDSTTFPWSAANASLAREVRSASERVRQRQFLNAVDASNRRRRQEILAERRQILSNIHTTQASPPSVTISSPPLPPSTTGGQFNIDSGNFIPPVSDIAQTDIRSQSSAMTPSWTFASGRSSFRELTRLREMRERQRLSVRQPTSMSSTRQSPNRQEPGSLWNSYITPERSLEHLTSGEQSLSTAARTSWERLLHLDRFSLDARNEDHTPRTSDLSMHGLSSSEAAAFFASSPPHDTTGSSSSRDFSNRADTIRRRRARLMAESNDPIPQRAEGRAESGNSPPFRLNTSVDWNSPESRESTNTSSFGLGIPSGPSVPSDQTTQWEEPTNENPTNELLQVLFPGHMRTYTNIAQLRRAARAARYSDVSPTNETRVRSWAREAHEAQHRGLSSDPPVLPPIRPSSPNLLHRINGERTLESDAEPNPLHQRWRGLTRVDASGANDSSRNDEYLNRFSRRVAEADRESEMTVLRARHMHHIIHNSGLLSNRERDSGDSPPPLASDPIDATTHHMMNPVQARYQELIARYRGRERDTSYTPRSELHRHWGELVDEPRSIRSALGHDSEITIGNRSSPSNPRTRFPRNTSPALFADPPANPDNAPPNRGRAGDPPVLSIGSRDRYWDIERPIPAPTRVNQLTEWANNNRNRRRAARILNRAEETQSTLFSRLRGNRGTLRNVGDFMRDEDLDTSYEGLLALGNLLGDVKPRATASSVLNSLPNAQYKDWRAPGCDTRCPICLDDYKDTDAVLKALPCKHWCHKDCLEQWLHSAQTCPVCRTKVKAPTSRESSTSASSSSSSSLASNNQPVPGPSRLSLANRLRQPTLRGNGVSETADSDSDMSFLTSSPGSINRTLSNYLQNHDGFHIDFD